MIVNHRWKTLECVRILIAKPGLDGHNRGAKVIAAALSDAGMHVIYTGIRKTPEQIVERAIAEDVQYIGLSSLSGGHMRHFPEIVERLRAKGRNDIVVIGGGIIPVADAEVLRHRGVAEIFHPGTSTNEVIQWLLKHAEAQLGTVGVDSN